VAKTLEERPRTLPSGSPAKPPKRRAPWLRPLFLAVSAVLAIAVAAGSIYGFSLYKVADSGFGFLPRHKGGPDPAPHVVPCANKICDYLIIGNDSRRGLSKADQARFGSAKNVPGARSDTIMLVRLDPRQERAIIVSFPRDLWVRIPGHGMGKITSAFEGGPDRVAQVVTNLTGLPINHFVAVNLAGFQNVVEALGGIPICVDRPMRDDLAGLNIPAGCQTLDAEQALAFVRARHVCGDRIPDFSRISRQQQFLRAVIGKILSAGMILKAQSLIEQVAPNLLVDDDMNLADIIFLTRKLQGINTGAVDFRSVPGDPFATVQTPAGTVDVVKMTPKARELFRRLREGEPLGNLGKALADTAPSPATVKVRVFDASSGGKAAAVTELLTKAGFDIRPTVAAGTLASQAPVILYRAGALEAAKVVNRFLPDLSLKQAPANALAEIDVAVVADASVAVSPTPTPQKPPGPAAGCP
jgi:LCP family protein required for cell wall assembly